MLTLRDYQRDDIVQLTAAFRGHRRVCFVLPTGGGKTLVAAYIFRGLYDAGKRALFVAHRKELINQTYRKFTEDAAIPTDKVGVTMRGDPRRQPTAPIQIASGDTLRNRPKPDGVDLVCLDEAHRACSAGNLAMLGHYDAAYHLLITATPARLDGKSLSAVADVLVIGQRPSALMQAGHLATPRVFGAPPSALPDLRKVRSSGSDYAQDDLAAACSDAKILGSIVDHWKAHAHGLQTLAFCCNVQHSMMVRDAFLAAGVRAVHVDGTSEPAVRDRALLDLAEGRIDVLCNCNLFVEGLDVISVKCIIMARPTQSTTMYLQQVGRALRPWNGIVPILLDHARNVEAHGFPQDDREWTLDPPKKRKPGMAPVRTCPACFCVMPVGVRVCPACGYEFVVDTSITEDATVSLVEVKPPTIVEKKAHFLLLCKEHGVSTAKGLYKKRYFSWPPRPWVPVDVSGEPSERQKFYQEKHDEATAKGYKDGWAAVQFKAHYQQWPSTRDRAFAVREVPVVAESMGSHGDHDNPLGTGFADWLESEGIG